jgi:hypothetical protein
MNVNALLALKVGGLESVEVPPKAGGYYSSIPLARRRTRSVCGNTDL